MKYIKTICIIGLIAIGIIVIAVISAILHERDIYRNLRETGAAVIVVLVRIYICEIG